jgi:hypothetical protein
MSEEDCLHPLLETAVAGLVRGVFLGQFPPQCPGTQHPQNPVQDCSRVLPWTTASIKTPLGPQSRLDQLPLGIAQFPSSSLAVLVTGFQPPANSLDGELNSRMRRLLYIPWFPAVRPPIIRAVKDDAFIRWRMVEEPPPYEFGRGRV